ncbi:hypothetical protein [Colwellia sp. Bg11-28]|uniref:hypothetical protein n=1 Tax=Colwellia sp. Bg11-28 TaxID=2058305 RepID=UPI000C342349|nr:hypothetical protein [Colwellia sp. Bg11-28]PKH88641.1 hypothetical protein CXF79_04505 [Colwellia sp. Bg11-28]
MIDKSNQTTKEGSTHPDTVESPPKKWWQWFLLYPTILVALVGAVPTYMELWNSKQKSVDFGDSKKAEVNLEMWKKNLVCTARPMDPYITSSYVEVDANICESGDVFIRIRTPKNRVRFEWVAVEKIVDSQETIVTMLNFNILNKAIASDIESYETLEFNSPRILCQKWINQNLILRRVEYPGKRCFDETINAYNGTIVNSVAAPCHC